MAAIFDSCIDMAVPISNSSSCGNSALSTQAIIPESLKQNMDYQELENSLGSFDLKVRKSRSISSCDFIRKEIVLDPSLLQKKVGDIYPQAVEALIFEMANLAQSTSFDQLVGRIQKLTPDQFVEEFERLEHKSAIKTKRILRKNFPISLWELMPIVYSHDRFAPHYLLQQALGHSQSIWEHHKQHISGTSTYNGTWISPVRKDEISIVKSLLHCLSLKEDGIPSISEDAKILYEKSRNHILYQMEADESEFYTRLAGRLQEIETAH